MIYKILYIDDNIDNLAIFSNIFSSIFDIVTTTDPFNIFNLLEGQKFDAILIDIHMPLKNGFQVLSEISESCFSAIPLILFTSDELLLVRYQALASKACDIMYRSMPDEEIELRILNKIQNSLQVNEVKKHLSFFNLQLNLETLEAFHSKTNLDLTPIEFKILAALINNFPEKISRETLTLKAWNQQHILDRTINTHLSNLRKKISKTEFSIESPRGTGILISKSISSSPLFGMFQ